MSTIRLKVTAQLQSRDGTLAKGARMKNLVAEKKGDMIKAIKRPGLSALLAGAVATGQGGITLGGAAYIVSGDTLRKINLTPVSEGTTWAL